MRRVLAEKHRSASTGDTTAQTIRPLVSMRPGKENRECACIESSRSDGLIDTSFNVADNTPNTATHAKLASEAVHDPVQG